MTDKLQEAAEFTEGICGEAAAILKDGVMMTIPEILKELNSRVESIAVPISVKSGEESEDAFIKKHLKIVMEKILDSMIDVHIGKMWGGLEMASIEHFVKTGKVNGSFLLNLRSLCMKFADKWHNTAAIPTKSDEVERLKGLIKQLITKYKE